MDAHLSPLDKTLFYKYLDNASNYFEYGSGGSTIQASLRDNIQCIYSVESDKEWQELLKKKIEKKNVTFMFNEMDTKPNDWGYPGENATNIQKKNYSNQMRLLDKNILNTLDLIFIDGRFRTACCLKCFDQINDDCLIAFDDFLNRPEYHIVLDYYDVIDKTDNNIMVILKKKNNVKIPIELIQQYELNDY